MIRVGKRVVHVIAAVAVAIAGIGLVSAPPAVAADDQLDLVLLLDGSGSIDAADWDLQLQGYAAALGDRVNFPTDGSVAVSVIQWSHRGGSTGNTRLEVPLTVLDSRGAVDALIAEVLAIQQIRSNTNPGDAVLAGTAELAERGRSAATGVLCLSTDGPWNSGATLASATSAAQSQGVGRFSVVAIADRAFTESQARAAYGPYVFGGGTVSFARSTAEFTTMIAGCATDPLHLVALEVTQSVQDLDNTVALVTNKPTVVRAYLATLDGDTVRATARLRGYANGVELPGSPLTALNSSNGILVDGDALSDRAQLTRTLNFRLPYTWTGAGGVEFFVEYAGGLICVDQSTSNPLCSQTVVFEQGIDSDVSYRGISWTEDGTTIQPSLADLIEQSRRVEAQLPISSFTWNYRMLRVGSRPGSLNALDATLVTAHLLSRAPSEQRWYGVIPGTDGGGLAVGKVASGWDAGKSGVRDFDHARNRGVHEIGHTYGLDHSVNAAENGYKTFRDIPYAKLGWCEEDAVLSAPDYPHWTDIGGTPAAAIGPMGAVRGQVWGMDTRFVGVYSPLALVDPSSNTSLMSYCTAADATSQQRWIGVRDYNRLLTEDLSPIGLFDADTAAPGSGLLVRATISPEGETTLDPALPVDVAPAEDDPEGTHEIAVLDVAGSLVHSVRFTPVETHQDAPEGGGEDPTGSIVNVVIPAELQGASRIELREGIEVLTDAAVTANHPEAGIQAPTTASDQEVAFEWSATDPDGDPVSTTLLYSADDGQSWDVVAIDITDQSVSLPRWTLPGSAAARVRVIASDGVNTTVATSPAFPMPNLPPTVTITSPEPDTLIAGAQTVVLAADAADAEDGPLADGRLTWASDLDGALGTGSTLTVRADELSAGTHRITVVARDSGGEEATASVVLHVERVVDPPVEESTCSVTYTVHGSWPTGFTAQIWIANLGEEPIDGWVLEWDLPDGQSVGHHWSSTMSMTGQTVTATNLDWNARIGPGERITVGFTGVTVDGDVAGVPSSFRLNGGTCG